MKNKKLADLLPKIQEHIVMRDHTSFRVGGVADFYFEAKTIEDLIKAVKAAIVLKMPYFILGNGSNILFSDYGFAGLVIKNTTSNIAIMKEKSQVIIDSGVMLSRLIMELASNDLAGLEFLFGVPGTVGGALYGNAGAWGSSIGDYLKNLTVLEIDENGAPKINQYPAEWMQFSYRGSKLKKLKSTEKPVILTARIQLAQNQKDEIIRRINAAREKRQKTQPVGFTAGSVFKNPMPKEMKNITGHGTKNMPEFPAERTAGFMLDSVDAKKLKVGAAEVSNIHANFILNQNGAAKATEIRSLIEEMRNRVNEKYSVILDEEIEYIGQW